MEASESQLVNASRARQDLPGLSQLICAALADATFAAHLLHDPVTALAHSAHDLQLTPEEYALVIAIRSATDIHDFAARLSSSVQRT